MKYIGLGLRQGTGLEVRDVQREVPALDPQTEERERLMRQRELRDQQAREHQARERAALQQAGISLSDPRGIHALPRMDEPREPWEPREPGDAQERAVRQARSEALARSRRAPERDGMLGQIRVSETGEVSLFVRPGCTEGCCAVGLLDWAR